MDNTKMIQMNPSAFIFPSVLCVSCSSVLYKEFVSTPRLKLDVLNPFWSCKPNISVRKGVNIVRDIYENAADSMLRLKYPATSLGYFFMYEKMILKLFISELVLVF